MSKTVYKLGDGHIELPGGGRAGIKNATLTVDDDSVDAMAYAYNSVARQVAALLEEQIADAIRHGVKPTPKVYIDVGQPWYSDFGQVDKNAITVEYTVLPADQPNQPAARQIEEKNDE